MSVPSWIDPVTGRTADYATTTMVVDGPGVFALTIDSTVVASGLVGSDGSGADNPEQIAASFSSTIEFRAP